MSDPKPTPLPVDPVRPDHGLPGTPGPRPDHELPETPAPKPVPPEPKKR